MEDKEGSDSAEVGSGQSSSEETTPYRCEYCGTSFRKHAKYIRHLRTHTKEKPFPCPFPGCEKAFSRRDHMIRHLSSHNEEYPFVCMVDGCTKKFKSQYNLNRHLKWHEKKQTDPPQQYKCSYCDQTFTKKVQLRRHEYFHTGVKPFACQFPGCTKAYLNPGQLVLHEKSHENTVCVCSVPGCSFSTPDLSVFKSHMESVHADVKPSKPMTPCYPCTVAGCSYVFTSKSSLSTHVATFHNHIKYKCEYCNKVYAQLSSLSRHKRVHRLEMDAEQAAELKRRRVMLALSGRVKPSCYLDMKGGVVDGAVDGVVDGAVNGKGGDGVNGQVEEKSGNRVDGGLIDKVDGAINDKVDGAINDKVDGAIKADDALNDTVDNTPNITPKHTHPDSTTSPTPPPSNANAPHSNDPSRDSSAVEGALSDSEDYEEETSLS